MPKIHSTEFRKIVMDHYKGSLHKSNTCKTFKVSRSTLDHWIHLEDSTGNLSQPKIISGRPFMIKDIEAFKIFFKTTPFIHIKDLIPIFEQKFGYKITYSALLNTINKLNLVDKKYRHSSKNY